MHIRLLQFFFLTFKNSTKKKTYYKRGKREIKLSKIIFPLKINLEMKFSRYQKINESTSLTDTYGERVQKKSSTSSFATTLYIIQCISIQVLQNSSSSYLSFLFNKYFHSFYFTYKTVSVNDQNTFASMSFRIRKGKK